MENIKYYLDLRDDVVLAYERDSEFFVLFNAKTNAWVACGFSFSAFAHDCEYAQISKEEACSKTSGLLPNEEYRRYLDMLHFNQ